MAELDPSLSSAGADPSFTCDTSVSSIKIKQEKVTPPPSPKNNDEPTKFKEEPTTADDNSSKTAALVEPTEKNDDKKVITPVKSSTQLLDELFQTFNAVMPENLRTDLETVSSKKKHKKEKKAKKSKHREKEEGELDDKVRHKKGPKVKKEKKDKRDKGDKPSKKDVIEKEQVEPVKVKTEKRRIGYPGDEADRDQERKRIKIERSESKDAKSKDRSSRTDKTDESKKRGSRSRTKEKESEVSKLPVKSTKITIKNLKDSVVFKEAEKESSKQKTSKSHRHHHRRRSDDHASDGSVLSLSDEETYFQERDRYFEHDRRDESEYRRNESDYRRDDRGWNRNRDRGRDRDREHIRRVERSDRNERTENRFYAGSDRFREERRSSTDREVIDKKRLLEIARKNAIRMLERGTLPGTQYITAEAKEKVLAKMRFGGKTVDELTEFCKKLSKGEGSECFFSDGDSDADADGNERAFNHPFVLKDRGPIVMNIRNSVPIQPKTSEQTKVILMQFPVSSGQHHRLNESEWVPVPKPKKPAAQTETSKATSDPASSSVQTYQAIAAPPVAPVFTIPILEEHQQTLLQAQPLEQPHSGQQTLAQFQNPPETKAPFQQQHPVIHASLQQPSVPVEQTEADPSSVNIFMDSREAENLDVTSIISKRLNAMRKLQDNPHDSEALKLMYNSQKDMTNWANSKYVPGQFTGSTGANILSARELTSGFQAWAKKDQLMSTTPVSGGMGMHLLQKMGWRPGEGLGKEKNGSLQPLLLEIKLDKKGLLANEENPTVIRKQQMQQQKQSKMNKQQQQQLLNQQHQQQLQQMQQKGGNNPPMNLAAAQLTLNEKHPVSHLGELAAKRKWIQPAYLAVEDTGPPHQKRFLFTVNINGVNYTPTQMSNTKKDAKMEAARCALQQMGIIN